MSVAGAGRLSIATACMDWIVALWRTRAHGVSKAVTQETRLWSKRKAGTIPIIEVAKPANYLIYQADILMG
jgi:hypothetical protein